MKPTIEDKPDFGAIASKMYYDNHNEDTDHILQLAMNFVWAKYVEPLQEKLSGFDAMLDTMNDQAKREFKELTNLKELAEKENERLKEEHQFLKVQLDKNRDVIFMNDDQWKQFGKIP